MRFSFSIALIALCIGLIQGSDDWSLLFSDNKLDLAKTESLIKKILDENKNHDGDSASYKKERLGRLWSLRELKDDKCTLESWNEFLSLADLYQFDEANIIPYMKHWKAEIAKYCSSKGLGTFHSQELFDWVKMEEVLYDGLSNKPVGFEKTQELMRKLSDLYEGRTDEGSIWRRGKVVNLLNACKLADNSCSKDSWASLADLFDLHEFDTVNVLPYLERCKRERTKYCKQKDSSPDNTGAKLNNWKKLYERVFASITSKPLGDAATFTHLKELDNMFKGRTDEGSKWRREEVKRLIDLSQFDEDKCSRKAWGAFVDLLEYHKYDVVNIIPYLNNMQSKLAAYCDKYRVRNYYRSDPNDWKEMHQQLYAEDANSKPLGVEKTLKLMEKLHALYEGRTDKGSIWRQDQLSDLIELSRLHKSIQCNDSARSKQEALLEQNQDYIVNIVPYLKHWISEHKKFCSV